MVKCFIKILVYKGDQTRVKRKEQELKQEISQKKFKRKKASDTYRD